MSPGSRRQHERLIYQRFHPHLPANAGGWKTARPRQSLPDVAAGLGEGLSLNPIRGLDLVKTQMWRIALEHDLFPQGLTMEGSRDTGTCRLGRRVIHFFLRCFEGLRRKASSRWINEELWWRGRLISPFNIVIICAKCVLLVAIGFIFAL